MNSIINTAKLVLQTKIRLKLYLYIHIYKYTIGSFHTNYNRKT